MDKVLTTMLFTKQDTLRKYAETEKIHSTSYTPYNEIRTISLVLKFGVNYNAGGVAEHVARIFCPINPLPVVGEFKTPSKTAVTNFLLEHGWSKVHNVDPKTLNIVANND